MHVTSEFLIVVLLKFQVFWNQLINIYQRLDVSHCRRLQGQFQLSVVVTCLTLKIRALRSAEKSVTIYRSL